VITFLTQHLGNPVASPALFKQIGDRFSNAVRSSAEINAIPVLHLNAPDRSRWDDRKVDHVREYVARASAPGVVAILVAQEVQKVFMGSRALFEALVVDNIGIGRPAAVSVVFARRVQRNTQSIFRTRVFTQGRRCALTSPTSTAA
jgi:hypothetical protein